MQACLETTVLPLIESGAFLPRESPTLPLLESAPWTVRIARPAAAGRNELAKDLYGVPKAALCHVFGKILGARLWRQQRSATAATNATATEPAVAATTPANSPVPDVEISGGLLNYLCAEAAATLRERKRLAKSITLTVRYSNGDSETAHQLLLQSTNDPRSLEAASQAAIRGMRSNAFVSLKLDLTATPSKA